MIGRLFFAALLCLTLLLPAGAEARWIEARSPNFIVYSEGGEAGLRASVTLLEDFDRLLRTLTTTTAAPSPDPLKVYLVRTAAQLGEVAQLPPGVLGFYLSRVGGTAAFAVRGDRPGMGGEEVLLHEYTHRFMLHHYPAYYPRWYSEGFAEYMMTARFERDRIEVGRFNPGRAITLLRGSWIPIDRVLSGNVGRSVASQGQYYAESWLIVHYLFASPERQAALVRYLAAMRAGGSEPQAFRTAFGTDHAGFEAGVRRYMAGKISYDILARPAPVPDSIRLSALPESADDLLLPHAALMIGIPEPAREITVLTAIREAARRYPADPYARKVLARAEIAAGDRAAGVAMVDRLLEASPDDPELLYLRGVADFYSGRKDATVRAARFAAARPWFARAVKADPAYYTAQYRLAQSSPVIDGQISDETLDHLLAAYRLAPLVGDIAVDTAAALVTRQHYSDAERVLSPIANDPHGGHGGEARALLSAVRAKTGTPALPGEAP